METMRKKDPIIEDTPKGLADRFAFAELQSYAIVEKITEGRSNDIKYKLEKDGQYFLLRVGDKAGASEKKQWYDRLKGYTDQGIHTHKPVAFCTTADWCCCMISWVDGTPIMDVIKRDVSKDYAQLGRKVGTELQKLHAAYPVGMRIDWRDVMEKKTDFVLNNEQTRRIEFSGSSAARQYLLDHIGLMANRPQAVLHGDFHWNNCVVDEKGQIGIIDFHGGDLGDPWYEFGGLLWALEYSESFANGQIDGYFGTVPDEFWEVFKFYTALYAFEHLTYQNGTAEDLTMRVCNAGRMLSIFGENFALDRPLFRREKTM